MRRTNALTAVLVVAAALLATPVATAPSAQADGTHTLPISQLNDILVDQAHGHVFLSAPNMIAVTDLDGVPTTTIAAAGAQAMVPSQDGSKVYVALGGADAVGVIDISTLTMTTISTGTETCPFDVAETAGRLWYSYGCWGGNIGYIDLANANANHPAVRTGFSYPPFIESSPALPDELVIASRGISPGSLEIATVTEGETAGLTTQLATTAYASWALRISPDGARILVTGYGHQVFLTSDLSTDGMYESGGATPIALAIRPDGMVAGGTSGGLNVPDVFVFKSGSRTVYRTYDFGPMSTLAPFGLAFGATRLYAVLDNHPGLLLRVITPRAASRVSIKASRTTYNFDATAKVTVHLTTGSSNKHVAVYAKPYGRAEKLIKTGNVDGSGNLVATLPVRRRTTFRVAYSGDASHDSAQGTVTVAVRARVTPRLENSFARSGKYYLVRASRDAALVGVVAPNHAGDCLYFTAYYYTGVTWRYFAGTGCVHMTPRSVATGLLDGRDLVGMKIRMRAEWRGDTENAAKPSEWRYVRFVR